MATKKKGKVVGVKTVNANLRKAKTANRLAVVRGITKWVLLVKAKAIPLTPVRVANLRGSAFTTVGTSMVGADGKFHGEDVGEFESNHSTVVSQAEAETARRTTKTKVVGSVGYSAVYAHYIHELPTAGAAGFDPDASDEQFRRALDEGVSLTAEKVHSNVGGPKFLINALELTRKQGLQVLAAEIRKDHR
jgi:hypothetical protein